MLDLTASKEKEYPQAPPAYGEMTTGTSLDVQRLDNKEKREIDIEVRSVNSTTTTLADFSDTLLPNVLFTPGPVFHVAARGVRAIRLPAPSSELEIDIYHSSGELAYTSTRARRSKGDSVLASPEHGDLLSTNYFFGPSKQPIIRDLTQTPDTTTAITDNTADDTGLFDQKSKWTSRSITLVHRESQRIFEWSYDKTKASDGKKANLLVLRVLDNAQSDDSKPKSSSPGRVLAQLVRSDKTRTPGTSSCSAGNGGQLVLDSDATAFLSEPLIMAMCLMMLKKEIDRQRGIQMMILTGMVSGGS